MPTHEQITDIDECQTKEVRSQQEVWTSIRMPDDRTVKLSLDGVRVPAWNWQIEAIHQGWSNFMPDVAEPATCVCGDRPCALLGRTVTVDFNDGQFRMEATVVAENRLEAEVAEPVLCILKWSAPVTSGPAGRG